MVKASLIDKAIALFSPKKAVERLQAKAAFHLMTRSYEGADTQKRGLKYWRGTLKSADRDDLPSLKLLRSRSRDLHRNEPLVVGAVETNIDSVIGAGLRVQANIDHEFLGLSEEEAAIWESEAERVFILGQVV